MSILFMIQDAFCHPERCYENAKCYLCVFIILCKMTSILIKVCPYNDENAFSGTKKNKTFYILTAVFIFINNEILLVFRTRENVSVLSDTMKNCELYSFLI